MDDILTCLNESESESSGKKIQASLDAFSATQDCASATSSILTKTSFIWLFLVS